MRICRYRFIGGVVILAGANVAKAQPLKPSQILRAPNGVEVEVIGLRRWTVQMIQDSLDRYAPGDSLEKHSCATTLRYTLHFADAAAFTYQSTTSQSRVVVSVREPQDSALVDYQVVPLFTDGGSPHWKALASLLRANPRMTSELPHHFLLREASPASFGRPSNLALDSAVAFLKAHATERDRLLAIDALENSKQLYDRVVAALLLLNFLDRDATYYTLLHTLREADGDAKFTAASVLSAASTIRPRSVHWTPVAGTLNRMLNGSSLFQLQQVMRVLAKTGVGPTDAKDLLGGGGEMVLAYFGSQVSSYREASYALLVALRGADLGPDVEPWRRWIDSM